MSIRILPEILSNKIAAGEVVERPASVVKELVENAIDAGSRRIRIEVERGGKSLIRVSDDGAGMGKDDALLSIERYATSKITEEKDLFSIRTLGFRGEALPSIASVSRFSIVTRRAEDDTGTRIEIEGGTIRRVSETGAAPGTVVAVRQLFFNTPARRKFLKTVTTEMSHITETISAVALARPRIGFHLLHDKKDVKQWPPVADGADRAADVIGSDLRRSLFPVFFESDALALEGWIGSPVVSRSTARGVYAFVNGRWVKDRVLQHALFSGYAGRLMKGRYPVAVLFLQVPFDRVDVNVHPTKNEVRFAEAGRIHDRLETAIRRTLSKADRPSWEAPASIGEPPPNVQEPRSDFEKRIQGSRFKIQGSAYRGTKDGEAVDDPGPWRPERASEADAGRSATAFPSADAGEAPPAAATEADGRQRSQRQVNLWPAGRFGDLRVVGQYANSYIVCEADRRLVLVDQHAAHERILYERIRSRTGGEASPSQGLLLSETVEFPAREAEMLSALAPRLAAEGFDIEFFGGQSFVVRAVPALLMDREITPILQEIAEKAVETGVETDTGEAIDGIRKIIACHGAVRAHQSMTEKEMAALLAELDRCADPAHCPHGRPTWIEWSETELEKRFGR